MTDNGNNLSELERRSLEVLDFGRVLERVADHASTRAGREAVLAMVPSADLRVVRELLLAGEEARRFLEEREGWSLPAVPESDATLRRLRVDGSVLTPIELAEVGGLLTANRTLAAELGSEGELGTISALGARLVAAPKIESAIQRAIGPEGTVLDGASRELRRLRSRLAGARNRVVAHLEELLGALPERHRVPDASVTIRDGRYVIPLRREGRRAVGGYLHDESSSGATVFVEPPSAIEMMNQLRTLELAEAREVHRILVELSVLCRPLADPLADSLAAITELDRRLAVALAVERWEGVAPEVAPGPLRLRRGRHPLLVLGDSPAVAFDLELEGTECVVVVTGPNAGGKTAFLKATGLIAALAQSGIAPPVGPGTRLPVFGAILAESGDGQSISDSLSTFSAHLASVGRILEEAESTSLVLIDEPGAGTDPGEGEALARALVETLAGRGCTAVVTSHLGGLKELAGVDDRIVNASLAFDGDRLAPTFRFAKGSPGRSYGLAIARGLGFPAELLDRAESYRDGRELRLDGLLARAEERDERAARLLSDIEGERERLDSLRTELERRQRRLQRREQEAASLSRAETRRMLLEGRGRVEAAILDLQAAASESGDLAAASRRARVEVEAAARELEEDAPESATGPFHGHDAQIEPGASVRMTDTGTRGVLVAIEGGRAVVKVGGLLMRLPSERVIPDLAEVGRAVQPRPRWDASTAAAPEPEVDLRGLRADEAERSLVGALDRAAVADLREVRVIHGKGTGALRKRVGEVLERDERVERFRAGGVGEGGFGVTVARMR